MSKSKQKAVALKYNAERDEAPVVIASGYGSVAEKIIDIAEQKGIPVFRDDSAASLLCMLEVGNSVPSELYEVIAAIYCQLLQVSSEIKGNTSAANQAQRQRKRSLGDGLTAAVPSPPPSPGTPRTRPRRRGTLRRRRAGRADFYIVQR